MSTSESCLEQSRPAIESPVPGGILRGLGTLYCRFFHRAISRPVHGRYRCWKCLREFELEW